MRAPLPRQPQAPFTSHSESFVDPQRLPPKTERQQTPKGSQGCGRALFTERPTPQHEAGDRPRPGAETRPR